MKKFSDIFKDIKINLGKRNLLTETNQVPYVAFRQEFINSTQLVTDEKIYNYMKLLEELGYIKFLNNKVVELCFKERYVLKSMKKTNNWGFSCVF